MKTWERMGVQNGSKGSNGPFTCHKHEHGLNYALIFWVTNIIITSTYD